MGGAGRPSAGHELRTLELQVFRHEDYFRELCEFQPRTVNTPNPGSETWFTEARQLTARDYRLFDAQRAVLPTKLPLQRFYEKLVWSQAVLNRKHLGFAALRDTAWIACWLLLKGQTNLLRMLWKFSRVYNEERQYADHLRPVKYAMTPPKRGTSKPEPTQLYVHVPVRLRHRATAAGC